MRWLQQDGELHWRTSLHVGASMHYEDEAVLRKVVKHFAYQIVLIAFAEQMVFLKAKFILQLNFQDV